MNLKHIFVGENTKASIPVKQINIDEARKCINHVDNAPTQCSPTQCNNKRFFSIQALSKKYNVRIIRIYKGKMGKGLVVVMSNFGVKSITRRYVVALSKGFAGCKEIGDYLDFCGDEKIISWHIDASIFKK